MLRAKRSYEERRKAYRTTLLIHASRRSSLDIMNAFFKPDETETVADCATTLGVLPILWIAPEGNQR